MACDFALTGPKFTIGIEDSITKNFLEGRIEPGALHIVREVSAEKMVKVFWVGSADASGEAKDGFNLKGKRWGCGQHVCNPVMEPVMVPKETYEISNYRV